MDDIMLCQQALLKAGLEPISALTDDSVEATACQHLLSEKKAYCLSLHPWRFAIAFRQLSRSTIDTPPESLFDAAYTLPGCHRIIAVRVNDYPIEFDRHGNLLLCDATEDDLVVAELLLDIGPEQWPGYFTSYVVLEMASEFAVSLAEDLDKSSFLARRANMALTAAKTADSQGRTAGRIGLGGFRNFVAGGMR